MQRELEKYNASLMMDEIWAKVALTKIEKKAIQNNLNNNKYYDPINLPLETLEKFREAARACGITEYNSPEKGMLYL